MKLLALLSIFVHGQTSTASDEEMLALGHERWMAKAKGESPNDKDAWFDAERRFGIAQTLRNERLMARSLRSRELGELQTLFANITKGACRLSDDSLHELEGGRVFLAEADVACSTALYGVIVDKPSKTRVQASEIWDRFRAVEGIHRGRKAQIERFGGYSYDQYLVEYAGFGKMVRMTMDHPAVRSEGQRQSVYRLCLGLIELTHGGDPLP